MELDKGTSVDEIRKKIAKGEIQTKVKKQLEKRSYFTVERVQRKKRDLTQIINKCPKYSAAEPGEEVSMKPKSLSAVELFAEVKGAQDGSVVVNKKIYKLADAQLLVSRRLC
uniref:Uncharacterized protein n=1 Tax=Opuntia streptacantha TaxID=393608 RepID=A0A7C8Z612_OPUST